MSRLTPEMAQALGRNLIAAFEDWRLQTKSMDHQLKVVPKDIGPFWPELAQILWNQHNESISALFDEGHKKDGE